MIKLKYKELEIRLYEKDYKVLANCETDKYEIWIFPIIRFYGGGIKNGQLLSIIIHEITHYFENYYELSLTNHKKKEEEYLANFNEIFLRKIYYYSLAIKIMINKQKGWKKL